MARRRPGTHNARRRFVESQVLRVLSDEYRRQARPERRRRGGRRPDRRGAEGSGPAAAPGARGQRGPRPHVAAPVAPRVPARPARRPAAPDGGRQGDPSSAEVQRLYRPRSPSLETVPWTVGDAALIDEARTLLGPRRGRPARVRSKRAEEGTASGDGILAAGPGGLARARAQRGDRVRGRHPRLRPHRRGRGAGPLADAAAHAGPPLALGLHDGGGRHRTGHRALGPRRVGRHHALT